MKQKKNNLSPSGRFAKDFISDNVKPRESKITAFCFLLVSIGWLTLGIKCHDSPRFVFATASGMIALLWFLKSGLRELIEKGYLKEDSNKAIERDEPKAQETR